jgi:hypothetical protein
MTGTDELCGQLAQALRSTVERELVRAVEIIEGRVPSNEEVARYGERYLWPDGREVFNWRSEPIVKVSPMANGGFTITVRKWS